MRAVRATAAAGQVCRRRLLHRSSTIASVRRAARHQGRCSKGRAAAGWLLGRIRLEHRGLLGRCSSSLGGRSCAPSSGRHELRLAWLHCRRLAPVRLRGRRGKGLRLSRWRRLPHLCLRLRLRRRLAPLGRRCVRRGGGLPGLLGHRHLCCGLGRRRGLPQRGLPGCGCIRRGAGRGLPRLLLLRLLPAGHRGRRKACSAWAAGGPRLLLLLWHLRLPRLHTRRRVCLIGHPRAASPLVDGSGSLLAWGRLRQAEAVGQVARPARRDLRLGHRGRLPGLRLWSSLRRCWLPGLRLWGHLCRVCRQHTRCSIGRWRPCLPNPCSRLRWCLLLVLLLLLGRGRRRPLGRGHLAVLLPLLGAGVPPVAPAVGHVAPAVAGFIKPGGGLQEGTAAEGWIHAEVAGRCNRRK